MNDENAFDLPQDEINAWWLTETTFPKREVDKDFRVSSRKLFLTYHGFQDSLHDLLKCLRSKLDSKYKILEYALAYHKTQKNLGYHVHAYLELQKKLDTRDKNFFDYNNYDTKHSARANIRCIKDRLNRNSSQSGEHRNAYLAEEPIEYVLNQIDDNSVVGQDYLISPKIELRLGSLGTILSSYSAAENFARKGDVHTAMHILSSNEPRITSAHYTEYKQNLRAFAEDQLENNHSSQGMIVTQYMITKLSLAILSLNAGKSATLVLIGKMMLQYKGALLEYLNNTYKNLNPTRIYSFKNLSSIPINCRILILDHLDMHNAETLSIIKSLLLVTCTTEVKCNNEFHSLHPPVLTLLLASSKKELEPVTEMLTLVDATRFRVGLKSFHKITN